MNLLEFIYLNFTLIIIISFFSGSFIKYIINIKSENLNYLTFYFDKLYLLLIIISIIYYEYNFPVFEWSLFDFNLKSDYFTWFFKLVFNFFLIFFFLIALKKDYFVYYEYFFILLLVVFFANMIFCINDFLLFYLIIEAISLSLFSIAGVTHYSIKSVEASLKYFVLGSVSSLLLLLGIVFLYGAFGTLNFENCRILFYYFGNLVDIQSFNFVYYKLYVQLIFAILLIYGSLLFKLGAAPLHYWLIDVYYGVNDINFFFFSIYSKYVYLFLLLKMVFFVFYDFEFLNISFFLFFGIISIIIGTIGVFSQIDIKKIMAFNSVVHVGFILIGLSINNFFGFFSMIMYILIYFTLNIFFFYFFFNVKNTFPAFSNLYDLKYIKSLSVSFNFSIAILFFSMAGLPPFLGFYSKFFILFSLNTTGYVYMSLISLLILIINLFTIYIYLRVVTFIYFDKLNYKNIILNIKNLPYKFIIFLFLLLNIFGFFFIKYLYFYLIYLYCEIFKMYLIEYEFPSLIMWIYEYLMS